MSCPPPGLLDNTRLRLDPIALRNASPLAHVCMRAVRFPCCNVVQSIGLTQADYEESRRPRAC
jgi:hypothetical protein